MLNSLRDVGHPEVSLTETDIHIRERGNGLVFEDALPRVTECKQENELGWYVFAALTFLC
jgi:hypothetical protein